MWEPWHLGQPVPALCHCLLQALETLVGHSRSWRGEAWGSGSSLALCSSPSPSLPAKAGLHCCLELDSTVWTSQGPVRLSFTLNSDPPSLSGHQPHVPWLPFLCQENPQLSPP